MLVKKSVEQENSVRTAQNITLQENTFYSLI